MEVDPLDEEDDDAGEGEDASDESSLDAFIASDDDEDVELPG